MRLWFKVTLNDGTNNVELYGYVTWLEGGDNNVRVDAVVNDDIGEILDNWESNATSLTVDITPICYDDFGRVVECPAEVVDYNSQSGTATLKWVYNPNGASSIYLTFSSIS